MNTETELWILRPLIEAENSVSRPAKILLAAGGHTMNARRLLDTEAASMIGFCWLLSGEFNSVKSSLSSTPCSVRRFGIGTGPR